MSANNATAKPIDLGVPLKTILKEQGFTPKDIAGCGLTEETAKELVSAYHAAIPELGAAIKIVRGFLEPIGAVHSVRNRLKDPHHLLAKVARQQLDGRDPITADNLHRRITDLAGVRAIHLFKGDWKPIHETICTTWQLREKPLAYVREGDSPEWLDDLKKGGCKVKSHPFGYRSVHYLAKVVPSKASRTVEIQVRTLFEEGWSEIDHRLRYPTNSKNEELASLLVIFNRLAGGADELGSFLRALDQHLAKRDAEYRENKEENVKLAKELQETIEKLSVSTKDKEKLRKQLSEYTTSQVASASTYLGTKLSHTIDPFAGTTSPTGTVIFSKQNALGMPSFNTQHQCWSCSKLFTAPAGTFFPSYCDDCKKRGMFGFGSSVTK